MIDNFNSVSINGLPGISRQKQLGEDLLKDEDEFLVSYLNDANTYSSAKVEAEDIADYIDSKLEVGKTFDELRAKDDGLGAAITENRTNIANLQSSKANQTDLNATNGIVNSLKGYKESVLDTKVGTSITNKGTIETRIDMIDSTIKDSIKTSITNLNNSDTMLLNRITNIETTTLPQSKIYMVSIDCRDSALRLDGNYYFDIPTEIQNNCKYTAGEAWHIHPFLDYNQNLTNGFIMPMVSDTSNSQKIGFKLINITNTSSTSGGFVGTISFMFVGKKILEQKYLPSNLDFVEG